MIQVAIRRRGVHSLAPYWIAPNDSHDVRDAFVPIPSDHDPLHLIRGDLIAGAVVEPGGLNRNAGGTNEKAPAPLAKMMFN